MYFTVISPRNPYSSHVNKNRYLRVPEMYLPEVTQLESGGPGVYPQYCLRRLP